MNEFVALNVWNMALSFTVLVLIGFWFFARWCGFSPAVPYARLAQLSVGMTAEQVTALLGRPRLSKHMSDGSHQWTYGMKMKRHVLMIDFSPEQKVRGYGHGIPGLSKPGPLTPEPLKSGPLTPES